MKGLVYIKNFAMTYIVALFITALIGQPVLNGIILTHKTTTSIVNTSIEEENNEELGDEESAEVSIECQLPKYERISFRNSTTKIPTCRVAKKASLVLEMFIPPPELV